MQLNSTTAASQEQQSNHTTVHIQNKSSKNEFDKRAIKFREVEESKKKALAMNCEGKMSLAENLKTSAAANKDLTRQKNIAWEKMLSAFSISKRDMKDIRRQGIVRSIVNMLYLLIIVGCELDLYGFMMAYATYWFMGYTIVNVLLILAPVGYVLAILMYMKFTKEKDDEEDEDEGEVAVSDTNYQDFVQSYMPNDEKESKPSDAPNTMKGFPILKEQRTPIKLEFYHFLPVLRYYLVIKDQTKADVEGIFRVNSLSSFTLGIAQIISIVFQVIVDGGPLTIFIKINIGSQIINWVITILYFVTPISNMMSASIRISALTSNSKDQLRDIKQRHMAESSKGAFKNDMRKAKEIERVIDREIALVGGFQNEDLSQYPVELKFKALRLLRERQLNGFAEI